MNLFHTSIAQNDAYYFGSKVPFKRLILNMGQAGVGTWTIYWEYWDGDSWNQLTEATNHLSDGTANLKRSGTCYVNFTPPSDWAQNEPNTGMGTLYWIRFRITDASPSLTTRPLGTQAWTILQILNASSTGTPSKVSGSLNYGYYSTTAVWIKARKSTSAPKYFPIKTVGSIGSGGLSATVSLTLDGIA
jgi:hypothetical protein